MSYQYLPVASLLLQSTLVLCLFRCYLPLVEKFLIFNCFIFSSPFVASFPIFFFFLVTTKPSISVAEMGSHIFTCKSLTRRIVVSVNFIRFFSEIYSGSKVDKELLFPVIVISLQNGNPLLLRAAVITRKIETSSFLLQNSCLKYQRVIGSSGPYKSW